MNVSFLDSDGFMITETKTRIGTQTHVCIPYPLPWDFLRHPETASNKAIWPLNLHLWNYEVNKIISISRQPELFC